MTRIVVADDDRKILALMSELLELFGYEVVTESSASRLLEVLRSVRPDILFQDVRMPGLDLAAHVAAIRADEALRSVSVILLSAAMDVRELAEAVGADGVLEKPFDPERMRALIEECAARRRR